MLNSSIVEVDISTDDLSFLQVLAGPVHGFYLTSDNQKLVTYTNQSFSNSKIEVWQASDFTKTSNIDLNFAISDLTISESSIFVPNKKANSYLLWWPLGEIIEYDINTTEELHRFVTWATPVKMEFLNDDLYISHHDAAAYISIGSSIWIVPTR